MVIITNHNNDSNKSTNNSNETHSAPSHSAVALTWRVKKNAGDRRCGMAGEASSVLMISITQQMISWNDVFICFYDQKWWNDMKWR